LRHSGIHLTAGNPESGDNPPHKEIACPELTDILQSLKDFFLREKLPGWLWTYYPAAENLHKKLPPDLDDTSLVSHALEKMGFERVYGKGSHIRFKHSDGRRTVVPVHGNEEIGVGLLNEILKQIKLSREEFERLR